MLLGAGEGWAKFILFNDRVRDEFATFFHNFPQTLALGVCLYRLPDDADLRKLIPGGGFGHVLCVTRRSL
ncbi:phosphoribosylformylglycinamidine synthase subunit PurQ [Escherichia coli]